MGGASVRAGIAHPRARPSPRIKAQYHTELRVAFIGVSGPRTSVPLQLNGL
jgi:hypothetical protein